MIRALKWALLITIAQITLLMALAPGPKSLGERYLSLNNWDSFHYRHIAEQGYQIPAGSISSDDIHEGRANVVFFPGYPMAARGMAQLTGFSVPVSQLLVSHLACLVFWIYFFLFFSRMGISDRVTQGCALAVAIHPAAFFLAAGYTESLFLFGMMGFLYWCKRWQQGEKASAWIAAAHGGVMSITRIVSFAPAAYPSFVELSQDGLRALKRPKFWQAVAISFSGIMGAILFFAYCQHRFGEWNLYFRLEEIGWQNHRRWFAVINPLSYVPRFFFEHTVDSLNRLAVLVTGIQLAQTFPIRDKKGIAQALWPLWVVAFFLFYIALTGKANANMDSMLRYTFPPFLLLLLVWADQKKDAASALPDRDLALSKWFYLMGILSLGLQIWCAYRFLRGKWVA